MTILFLFLLGALHLFSQTKKIKAKFKDDGYRETLIIYDDGTFKQSYLKDVVKYGKWNVVSDTLVLTNQINNLNQTYIYHEKYLITKNKVCYIHMELDKSVSDKNCLYKK